MAKLSLDDRLNQIEDKISEKSFRENKGLGNEVGYYIFDYDPREELYVRNHIAYLKDRINNGNKDFRIVEFDLFHLMVEILQEEGYLEAFFDLEKENGFFEMAGGIGPHPERTGTGIGEVSRARRRCRWECCSCPA